MIEQPGAQLGERTYCPVSGVVFEVKATSPRHELDGKPLYFCCPGCANYFDGNRDDVIAKRRLRAPDNDRPRFGAGASPIGASAARSPDE